MKACVVIPARGGSKGIPRKNMLPLAGKPLLAHTIEQARWTRSIARVIVSTDDSETAVISRQYGAEVIWRPAEISGDTASSELALLHALEYLRTTEEYEPDLLVFLQCTSPLMLAEDIDGTVQVLLDEDADSALAVAPFHYFLWRRDAAGNGVGINHDKRIRLRRQEQEPQYLETGAVYVMRTQGFLQARHRFFGKTALYVMPSERCLEIDEPADLQVAEVLLRKREQRCKVQALPDPVRALVLDFDGVFTDNRVLTDQDGHESVFCHRGDGWGLAQLKALGLPLLVISSEENPVVQARCAKLGILCLQGVRDKLAALVTWAQKHAIPLAGMIYIGNDINDLDCLRAVGCGVVVRDAHPDVYSSAHIILDAEGGQGAIRELADLIVQRMKEA